MDVVHMCPEILLIADHMIPKASLPQGEGVLEVVCVLVISSEIPLNAVHYFGESLRWMVRFD